MRKVKLPISSSDKYIPQIYVRAEQFIHKQWILVAEFRMNSNGYFNQVEEYQIYNDPWGEDWPYEYQPCSYRGGYTLSELKRLLKKEGFTSISGNWDEATGDAAWLIKK